MSRLPLRTSLLVRLREGNGRGADWSAFVAFFTPPLLRLYERRFRLPRADALDLVQDVLLKVFRKIDTFDPASGPSVGSFQHWLFAIATNTALNCLRQRRRRSGMLGVGGSDFRDRCQRQPAPADGPEPDSEADALAFLIREALPDMLREADDLMADRHGPELRSVRSSVAPASWNAFLLFEVARLAAKEIAPLLDLQPGAVHRSVARVRGKIAAAFGGGPLAEQNRSQEPPSGEASKARTHP